MNAVCSEAVHRLLQDCFDKVWTHYIVEGNPHSYVDHSCHDGDCAYRGGSGARCAIGVLMKDEFYDESMEGDCVETLLSIDDGWDWVFSLADEVPGLTEADKRDIPASYFVTLQRAHDRAATKIERRKEAGESHDPREIMGAALERAAEQWNLEVPQ